MLDGSDRIRQAVVVHSRVDELVRHLELIPHPEGGFFRETFRSTLAVDPKDGRPERNALTGIYCLFARCQHAARSRTAALGMSGRRA